MHKITNPTNSPYDLETVDGLVRLPAFGSVEGEFEPAYLEALRGVGMYEVSQAKQLAKGADDADLEELRAKAGSLGIEVDGRWGEKRLESEIAKAEKD